MEKPTYNLLPHELFDEIQKTEERDDRIALLKEKANSNIKTFLALAWNDNITFAIPKGKPPYKENTPEAARNLGLILKEVNTLRGDEFVKTTQFAREKKFIGMLEMMHPEDAKLFIACKDGNLLTIENKRYSKITKSLVEATFPEILKIGEKK